jgi:hypothetical protein
MQDDHVAALLGVRASQEEMMQSCSDLNKCAIVGYRRLKADVAWQNLVQKGRCQSWHRNKLRQHDGRVMKNTSNVFHGGEPSFGRVITGARAAANACSIVSVGITLQICISSSTCSASSALTTPVVLFRISSIVAKVPTLG